SDGMKKSAAPVKTTNAPTRNRPPNVGDRTNPTSNASQTASTPTNTPGRAVNASLTSSESAHTPTATNTTANRTNETSRGMSGTTVAHAERMSATAARGCRCMVSVAVTADIGVLIVPLCGTLRNTICMAVVFAPPKSRIQTDSSD